MIADRPPDTGDRYDLPFDPETGDVVCRRDGGRPGVKRFNIRPVALHHSPTGFEWGYAGSGPADFALNILARFIPEGTSGETVCGGVPGRGGGCVDALAWEWHQAFKWDFVACLPDEGGTIPGEAIRAWLRERGVEPTG